MSEIQKIIDELHNYNKGEMIPYPDECVILRPLPHSLVGILSLSSTMVRISRRSLAHILQKGWVGKELVLTMEKCISEFDEIYESSLKKKRYLLLKKKVVGLRDVAVVIELHTEWNQVITCMVADTAYIARKYKKLR